MEMEYEILEARSAAEKANHAKSEFLSRMSHELRTPLNAILGFTQLLELDALTEEQRESTAQILRAGKHLLALINEVLDVTRIEAGRLALSPEPVLVREVAAEAADLTMHLAHNLGVRVAVDESHDGINVRADRQRLKQVLVNLLSNGIKYNRRGGRVLVTCASLPGEATRISVADTGFGIPSDKHERLFVPFDRLGREQSEVEGTGLGLALSKALVEAMGGRLGVTSAEGSGSTFWIDLPRAPFHNGDGAGDDAQAEHVPAAPGCSGTVLFIEDNPANVRLVERVLQRRRPGVRLLSALTGGTGLQLARETPPDLILLDQNLPDLSGVEVLQALRGEPALGAIPVVMVSGDAMPEQIERIMALGIAAYVTKPFAVDDLLAVMDSAMNGNPLR
jgi:CheY-like chemotaxis protein